MLSTWVSLKLLQASLRSSVCNDFQMRLPVASTHCIHGSLAPSGSCCTNTNHENLPGVLALRDEDKWCSWFFRWGFLVHWKFQIAVPGLPVFTSECPWCSANPCGHRWGIFASSWSSLLHLHSQTSHSGPPNMQCQSRCCFFTCRWHSLIYLHVLMRTAGTCRTNC